MDIHYFFDCIKLFILTIFSAIRSDAASIILPSNCAAPLPSAAALANSSIILFALSTSASGGEKTAFACSICDGWIAHLPSIPIAIGIEGKWAIHPSQIEHANAVFSPPEAEVDKAKRIIEELAKAAAEGRGAAQLDGRMIDAASERMAENIVNINNLIQSKK